MHLVYCHFSCPVLAPIDLAFSVYHFMKHALLLSYLPFDLLHTIIIIILLIRCVFICIAIIVAVLVLGPCESRRSLVNLSL